jgi:RNA polymerase sigma-70 factor (ECF subfamily)
MIGLIEPLIPALRRYARSCLRDRAAADDLVQDCLERAVGRWHQRRRDGDARTWIFTILHNLAVSRLRQQARRGWPVALDAVDAAAASTPPGQEEGLRQRDLMAALAGLPEDQRCVLLLVSVEGLSYAEVAAVTGVPVGTVMSRLSRGRDRLARLLDLSERPVLRRVK